MILAPTFARYGLLLLFVLSFIALPRVACSATLSAEEFTRLVAQLQEKDAAVRAAAVKQLGEMREARAGEAVLTVVHDADPTVRSAAATALALSYAQAVKELIPLFKDPDPEVRAAAARAAWSFRDKTLVDPLFALLPDEHPRVRAAAAYTLGYTYDVRVLEPLRVLLGDDSPEVRAAAAHGLSELAVIEQWVKSVPVGWTKYFDDPQRLDQDTRDKLLPILQQLGWDKTCDALAKLLTDKDPPVRGNAILALQRLRDPRAKPLLAEGLKGADAQLRQEVIWQFSGTDDLQFIDVVSVRLRDSTDQEELHCLLGMLASHPDRRTFDTLLELLPKINPAVRADCIVALGGLRDPRAISAIRPYLQDANPEVRRVACLELGNMADQESLDAILKMLNEPDATMRETAIWVLLNYHDARIPKAVLALLPETNTRGTILRILDNNVDATVVEPLMKYKDDPVSRPLILRILAKSGDATAAKVILGSLKSDDPVVRRDAEMASLNMTSTQLVLALTELQDTDKEHYARFLKVLQKRAYGIPPEALADACKTANVTLRRDIAGLLRMSVRSDRAVELLRTLSKDPDEEVRLTAVQGLLCWGKAGEEDAVLLSGLFNSKNPETRKAVIEGLANWVDQRKMEMLLAALKDPDAGVRGAAADELGRTHYLRVIEPLLAALQDADAGVRMHVVTVLGAFPDPRVAAALLPLLKETDHDLRLAVVRALWQQRGPQVTEALLEARKDPDEQMQCAAIRGLGAGDDPRGLAVAIAALNSDDKNLCSSAVSEMQFSKNPAIVAPVVGILQELVREEQLPALAMLLDSDGSFSYGTKPDGSQSDKLASILQVLRNKFEVLPEAALPLLRAATPRQRALGAALLVHTRDSRTLPGLAGALKDDSALVRRLAARALRMQGDLRSLPPLLAALRDPDDAVRAEVALALGAVQDARATAPLLALLKAQNLDVQFAAVWALGRIADPQAVKPLLAYYPTCTDPDIREELVAALGRMHDPQTADFFLNVLKDGTLQQRSAAIQALGALKERRAVDALIAVMQVPPNSYSPQAQNSSERNEIRSLGYSSKWWSLGQGSLCNAAITALGDIGEPRAIDPLIEMLNTPGNGSTIEFSVNGGAIEHASSVAAKALGQFRDARAATALLARLTTVKNPDYNLVEALVSGAVSEVAVTPIISALQAPNPPGRDQLFDVVARIVQNGRRDPRLTDLLLTVLPELDKDSRRSPLVALGASGDPRAVEPLLTAMKDKETRSTAVFALRTLKAPATAVPALKAILGEQDAALRKAAAEVLGTIRAGQAADALATALTDPDEGVRDQAAFSLCAIGDTRGQQPVLTMLKEHRYDTEGWYAPSPWEIGLALTGLPTAPAREAVLQVLDNADLYTARNILQAIWKANDPRMTELLLARARQELASPATGEMPPRCYSHTLEILFATVRDAVEMHTPLEPDYLSARLSNPQLLELCITLLQSTTPPIEREYGPRGAPPCSLRRNAIWLLGHSANPRAVPPLTKALEAGPFDERQETATALKALNEVRRKR